jgi:signal transduction histidine kinase
MQGRRTVLRYFKWSIRLTLLAIMAAVLALIMGLGGLSFARLAMVDRTASAVRDTWLPATRDLAEVARLTEHYRMIEGVYLLVESDGERLTQDRLLTRALNDRDMAWRAYERTVLPGEQRRLADRIDEKWRVFFALSYEALVLMREGRREEAHEKYLDAKPSFAALRSATADGVAFNARGAAEASDRAAAAYTSTRLWIGAGLVLGVLFSCAGAAVTIFRVSRPILQMAQTMKRLAGGDMSAEIIGVGRRGEIGEMADALKVFKENVSQLRSAHTELEAMKEIAEAANRATQTANATLELRIDERTRELRAAQDEILNKERLAVMGQITATVAHELRNPLSAIKNSTFMLKQIGSAGGSPHERAVTRIEHCVERCDRIVAELLDYTRGRDLRCVVRGFDEWLGELVAELTPPPGGAIDLDLRAGGASVKLDSDRFRRVIINLLDNAVQAMGDAKPDAAPPRIIVRTRAFEHAIELEIEDNGPGIPPDVLVKVFEPLFSTKSFGTGLGLPTVKQIVEQHAGSIKLTSVVGQGTRASISLPVERKSVAA